MAVRPFIVAPGDHANTLDIVGEHVTVLASGEATEGYEIFLQRGLEGSGPPPHSHPWDESFYVVKGEIDFVNGGSLLQGRNAVSRDRASSSRRARRVGISSGSSTARARARCGAGAYARRTGNR
jgi:hypothetical protein